MIKSFFHLIIVSVWKKVTPHITKETFVIEKMYSNINVEQRKNVSVLVVKDSNQYIESIVMDLGQRGKLQFDGFHNYLWVLFSGDKGGKLIKFLFEVINSKDAGSVYVHIYAMYKSCDCHQNMILVLLKFFVDIERLQSEEFLLHMYKGYKVKVFLGGDFKFFDDYTGHQGSAATYSSAKYSVHRDHQKNHPKGKAHTPENCPEKLYKH